MTTEEFAAMIVEKVNDINLSQKVAMMTTGNLSKNISKSHVLPIDDEIAPALVQEEDGLGYSEWKKFGYL